jgi:hypothetical protein
MLYTLLLLFVLVLAATGTTFFWRNCIYSRGAIFRPIGRLLDSWVEKGTLNPTFFNRVLRFIAYPLGRCVYCSGFHIAYDIFILANIHLELGLSYYWLIIVIPINHLLIMTVDRLLLLGNPFQDKDDWDSLLVSLQSGSPLTKEEEEDLEKAKITSY